MTDPKAETAGIRTPRCASEGCPREGYVKSEAWGLRLCSRHAVSGPVACDDCGHRHTNTGCVGAPTPSDLWAGVSPYSCDCDALYSPASSEVRHGE